MTDDWIPLTHDLEKPNNSLAVDPSPWKVLVVDDDPEVHEVTDFVPRDLRLFGRPLRLLPAHDGARARARLRAHPDPRRGPACTLPIDCLKIDRIFIKEIQQGKGGLFAETIVSLSEKPRVASVAEGVETLEQAGFLRGLGCTAAQGYLYAPPMPADQLEEWLRARLTSIISSRKSSLAAWESAIRRRPGRASDSKNG